MKVLETSIKWLVWSLWLAIIAVSSYYILANAAWLIGDDTQVLIYTGWDKPIFGFFCPPEWGRFFPLDYTVYDILPLFFDGQISATAHYVIHVFWFVVYIAFFAAIAFHILKEQKSIWKYAITFFVLLTVFGRTYIHFAQIWCGIWTILAFMPIFLYGYIRFFETKKWGYAIMALLAINYVLYYYETMFTIPLAVGACSLLFSYKQQDKPERIFNYLLVASGVLFLLLYAVLILPRIETVYGHYASDSLLMNAFKALIAQKIMWLVLVTIVVRCVLLFRGKTKYTIYDSLLLGSCAYFIGVAVLHLDYTLYYTPAVVLALPALLYYAKEYLKPYMIFIIFALLAALYVRKIPRTIVDNQKERVETHENMCRLKDQIQQGAVVYFYIPDNPALNAGELDLRSCRPVYLERLTAWYLNEPNYHIVRLDPQNGFEPGILAIDEKDEQIFINECPSASPIDINFKGYKLFTIQ